MFVFLFIFQGRDVVTRSILAELEGLFLSTFGEKPVHGWRELDVDAVMIAILARVFAPGPDW